MMQSGFTAPRKPVRMYRQALTSGVGGDQGWRQLMPWWVPGHGGEGRPQGLVLRNKSDALKPA